MIDLENATREQLLERAQLLKKAKDIQASQTGQPGAEAMGFPNGPTPAAEMDLGSLPGKAGAAATAGEDYDKTGFVTGSIGAGAKALDVGRGALTAPALAALLGGVTGKDVYRAKEHLQAINPTNLTTYPSASEIYERAGVPEGAKLSDYLSMYKPKGEASWYQPEKGGPLDFTLRGAGGLGTDVAIDPLTYMTFGAEPGIKTGLKVIGEKLAQGEAKGLGMTELKQGLQNLLQKPSEATAGLGKRLYRGGILPAEFEGAKYGKSDVGDTFYRMGIKTPFGLGEKAQKATQGLLEERGNLFKTAAEKGGQVDIDKALAPAIQKIQEIRSSPNLENQWIADELEKKVNEYKSITKGTPAEPAIGQAAKPGMTISPQEGSDIKSALYNQTPNAAWNEMLKTPQGAKVIAPLSTGFKTEAEQSVQRALGGDSAERILKINEDIGKLIGTKGGQRAIEKQAERSGHAITSLAPSGTESIIGAMLHENPAEALKAILLKRAGQGLQLSTMPVGYGLRKAGEGPLSGRLIDTLTRRKFIDKGSRGSEEQRKIRSGYGEEE